MYIINKYLLNICNVPGICDGDLNNMYYDKVFREEET